MDTLQPLTFSPDPVDGARRIAVELDEARRLLARVSDRLEKSAALAANHPELSEMAEPLRQAQAVARSALWRQVSQAMIRVEKELHVSGRAEEVRSA